MEDLIAQADATRHKDGIWTWKLRSCPHCGAAHTHGGSNSDEPLGGHRAAHCDSQFGYFIVPAAQVVTEVTP